MICVYKGRTVCVCCVCVWGGGVHSGQPCARHPDMPAGTRWPRRLSAACTTCDKALPWLTFGRPHRWGRQPRCLTLRPRLLHPPWLVRRQWRRHTLPQRTSPAHFGEGDVDTHEHTHNVGTLDARTRGAHVLVEHETAQCTHTTATHQSCSHGAAQGWDKGSRQGARPCCHNCGGHQGRLLGTCGGGHCTKVRCAHRCRQARKTWTVGGAREPPLHGGKDGTSCSSVR